MPEQDPKKRITNFKEVPLGFSEEFAQIEANRCLQCGVPKCVHGCPVDIDIPGFIKLIKEKKYRKAIEYIKEFNILPAVCGRVCPQEIQCEQACILGKKKEPIAIGALERFIADWERKNSLKACPDCRPPNNIKVAIIGSGPAGLTCAADLARLGYDITIFEAFHKGGGVLAYGIPEFRLPKNIVKEEIDTLEMLGVKIEYNKIIGKILSIDDMRQMGFKAFFIGVGAGLPIMLNFSGLNLNGVVTANELLTRANLMKAYKFPEYDTPINIGRVITVIGGGNVALDSARVALRLGAEKVTIVYRRSDQEMPARREEYHHALDEGIVFQFLTNPIEIIGDQYSNVEKLKVIKMRLGEPDDSGRRKPLPIEGSEFFIPTDTVILAVGTRANPILTKTIPDLKLTKYGYIETDEIGRTNIKDIFAGGDICTGSATVISAMGAGRKAAEAIDEYLKHESQK
jgi:glutamate synthase (NADPH/NADH) small chain